MNKINFKNLPDTSTPLSAENLNLLQDNVEDAMPIIDNTVSTTSTNGIENQAITNYVNTKTNLATISGYDASKTQVLKNVNGTLTWVDEL